MHPFTPLTITICAMLTIMVANSLPVSILCGGLALLISLFSDRMRRAARVALLMSIPVALSYQLIYAPFGTDLIAQLSFLRITSDGMATAGVLTARFAATLIVGLVGCSLINTDELMRAAQLTIPASLVYMVGSLVRLLPMARERVQLVSRVQRSRGVDMTLIKNKMRLILPVVVGLLDDAGQRSRPLQRSGIGVPGPRTVLIPVPDRPVEKYIRWAACVLMIAVIIWSL